MVPYDVNAKFPHLAKFWPYLELLKKESPRGKVLISTGFIEEQLKEILLAFMLQNTQATELVDGANAPLGTFSSRISACFVLGLISEPERHDLTLIRRIRNDFAHDIHATFETRSVVDRCNELILKAPDYTNPEMKDVIVGPAGQFDTAAVALIMNLTNRPHYVSQKRCVASAWPY
jgi:mannitol operon repressor